MRLCTMVLDQEVAHMDGVVLQVYTSLFWFYLEIVMLIKNLHIFKNVKLF